MGYEPEEERWIWLSFNPAHRIILAVHAGSMTQESADSIIKKTGERINEEELPLFVTDGRKFYSEALLKRYGYKKEFPPTCKRGRPRKTRQMPHPKLKYAQVKKKRESGKVVNIEKKIIYGEDKDIDDDIISTAYIERENLTLRQDNNRLARKTLGYFQKIKDFLMSRILRVRGLKKR